MQILFTDTQPKNVRLNARIVNKGDSLADLDPALSEGSDIARFKGNPGQVFEGFVSVDGALSRVAIAGAGAADATDRRLNLERSGAGLTAKYLRSGETEMVLDLSFAGLAGCAGLACFAGLKSMIPHASASAVTTTPMQA